MIFSKRALRRMLDHLNRSLEPVRLKELEGKLTRETDQTRAAEWEVVIAYALSQAGQLQDFENAKPGNPDFIWQIEDQLITVEVTCVSDTSLHAHNPVNYFRSELNRVFNKRNLRRHGAISYDLGSVEIDNKVTIAIPDQKEIAAFFKSTQLLSFLDAIENEPQQNHEFEFNARGATSKIIYSIKNACASGRYRSYNTPQTYRHSPIFNTLRAKELQLKRSETTNPAILFICDNDCDALRPNTVSSIDRVSMRDIVGLFLNGQKKRTSGDFIWQDGVAAQGRRIHAVIWMTIHEESQFMIGGRTHKKIISNIEYANYADPYLKAPALIDALNRALNCIPVPLRTARSAAINPKYSQFHGAYELSDNHMKLSTITLQKLLSGEISHEDFHRDHPELCNLLKKLTAEGRMISEAKIDISENNDDDWITFHFGQTHPDMLFNREK